MIIDNIVLEGADCSGKSTLFEVLHKDTSYRYNIHDRSNLSMYIYSDFYQRKDSNKWYNNFWKEIKSFNTLYVILLPKNEVIKDRIDIRGDDKQTVQSAIDLNNKFRKISKFYFRNMFPNILSIDIDEKTHVSEISDIVQKRLITLENSNPASLVRDVVFSSGKNELTDITFSELTYSYENKSRPLDWHVLEYPPEKEYYEKIRDQVITNIERVLVTNQTLASRRFIYTDDSCISLIHALYRDNILNVNVTMRSSNVSQTLWADYEFLRIICLDIANAMNIQKSDINLTVNIRSAHINP
tara:strand:- start:3860 stop:4756 length:897 start_codon:yes stop_codon:yes gene_type:complete